MRMEFISLIEQKRTPIDQDWFDPELLPSYSKDYLSVGYDPESRQWVIEPEAYTGVIPINAEYGIQLFPKSGLRNLTYMLFRSGLLNRSLETPFEQTVPYHIPDDDLESFFEGLVDSFLKCLDEIKRLGLYRQTYQQDQVLYGIRGKIKFREWVGDYPHTFGIPIPQQVFTSEIDNFANRVLRWTLEYLLLAPLKYVSKSAVLDRVDYFGRVTVTPLSESDLEALDHLIEAGRLPSSRYYYVPALNLALMILRGAGLSLGEEQDVEFKPILIKTYEMFERYVRILCHETANRYSARAENGKQFPLKFYSSSGPNVQVEPDIVVRYGGTNLMVMDVKYKDRPKQQDHYQLWAYMQTYDVRQGGFISLQEPDDRQARGVTWYERDGRRVFDFPFDCRQIKESEGKLDELLASMLERSV